MRVGRLRHGFGGVMLLALALVVLVSVGWPSLGSAQGSAQVDGGGGAVGKCATG